MADSVTEAVARIVASAKREADAMPSGHGWLMLRMLTEVHQRAADEIKALADARQPPLSARRAIGETNA